MPKHDDDNLRLRNTGRRAPEGQGHTAPLSTESGEPPQFSIFDGAGNESVVVLGENEKDGRVAEGTGATLEEAMDDARKGDTLLGDDFSPGKRTS